MKKPGELCDDGNVSDDDWCKADCSGPVDGWLCGGGDPDNADTCTSSCGDNFIVGFEQCEQSGDILNGDGCSSDCMFENGWICSPVNPAVCTEICGDGIRVGSEACDDVGIGDGKNCNDLCTGPEPGYVCVGGDATSPSSCSEVCGDGIITESEECDD